ncbi:hypothetical protein OH77DRAFT_152680 [Trametes cingulata]|nr:hypothetical protein OH77DRAFT_152680 [Trametes cingulata]
MASESLKVLELSRNLPDQPVSPPPHHIYTICSKLIRSFLNRRTVGYYDTVSASECPSDRRLPSGYYPRPAIFLWHYVTTLDKEVQLFWGRRVTGACVLFFANRYLPALIILANFATPWWAASRTYEMPWNRLFAVRPPSAALRCMGCILRASRLRAHEAAGVGDARLPALPRPRCIQHYPVSVHACPSRPHQRLHDRRAALPPHTPD